MSDKNLIDKTKLEKIESLKSIKKEFQIFFNDIIEEWKEGFKLLKEKLDPIKNILHLNTQKRTYIRDPLWGEIILNKLERILLDSFFIQRLRNINQMGGTRYVYPSANHKRFDHSLGTFGAISLILDEKLFKRRSEFFLENLNNAYQSLIKYLKDNGKEELLDQDFNEKKLEDDIEKQINLRMWINNNLKISMLLHDIGHYPFSHAFEVLITRKKNLVKQYRVNWQEFPRTPHEQRGKEIILGEDQVINEFFPDNPTIFKDFFIRVNYDYELISKSITGESNFCLSELINGPLDADKMDYLARDYYFTMAPSHLNIFDRIYRLASIQKKDGDYKLIFKEKAISAIIKIILTRTFEFNDIVNHPIQLCFQGMFIACLENTLQKFEENFQIEILKRWELMNDYQLFKSILILSKNDPLINNLLYGIKNRVFYKEVLTLKKSNYIEFISLMEVSNMDSLFIDGHKMQEIFTKSKIEGMSSKTKGVVEKLIVKMEEKYGILIFFNKGNKNFINYVKKILIQESESGNIIPLSIYITERFMQNQPENEVSINFARIAEVLNILEKIDDNLMIYSEIHIKDEAREFFNLYKNSPKKLKHFLAYSLTSEIEDPKCWDI